MLRPSHQVRSRGNERGRKRCQELRSAEQSSRKAWSAGVLLDDDDPASLPQRRQRPGRVSHSRRRTRRNERRDLLATTPSSTAPDRPASTLPASTSSMPRPGCSRTKPTRRSPRRTARSIAIPATRPALRRERSPPMATSPPAARCSKTGLATGPTMPPPGPISPVCAASRAISAAPTRRSVARSRSANAMRSRSPSRLSWCAIATASPHRCRGSTPR